MHSPAVPCRAGRWQPDPAAAWRSPKGLGTLMVSGRLGSGPLLPRGDAPVPGDGCWGPLCVGRRERGLRLHLHGAARGFPARRGRAAGPPLFPKLLPSLSPWAPQKAPFPKNLRHPAPHSLPIHPRAPAAPPQAHKHPPGFEPIPFIIFPPPSSQFHPGDAAGSREPLKAPGWF